jgi:DNA-binding response OmpR family regulator
LKKVIIVLAEDDHQIASLVKFKLEKDGYTVHLGENGRVALDLIKQTVPDMVILDVMMPVMDGFDVLRTIKSSDDTSNIPVIMLTAREMEEDVLKGFDLGAVDYMTKPFSPSELSARVRVNLDGKLR